MVMKNMINLITYMDSFNFTFRKNEHVLLLPYHSDVGVLPGAC